MSRFVFREAIELTGFFFIYLNRNLPQSCTFVSTGWTPVCNITIQGTPRDLPSILKCSNLSGFPTLTSLASRMVSNTISQILMRWSGYGQMDQCCTVWGEWGMDMSIYSPGGQVTGLSSGKYVPLASHNSYPIIGHSVAKYRYHPIHFWQNIVFAIPTKYLSVYASILLTRSSWNELTHWLNLMKSKSVFIFNSLLTSIFWYAKSRKMCVPMKLQPHSRKCDPIQRHIPISLLVGSTPRSLFMGSRFPDNESFSLFFCVFTDRRLNRGSQSAEKERSQTHLVNKEFIIWPSSTKCIPPLPEWAW